MPDDISRLKAELDEVADREARHRLACAQDILALEARLAEAHARIERARLTALERDTTMHERNLEIIDLHGALRAAYADLETFTWMLGEAVPAQNPVSPDLPGLDFVYFLHTPPFRIYRGDRFRLRGWLFPRDGRRVTSVRVRVDEGEHSGRLGFEEPAAIAQHGPQDQNPQPGFEIEFPTPPGRHRLRLEACLEGRAWYSVLCLPIWCRPG
jgi:hypothetical protein